MRHSAFSRDPSAVPSSKYARRYHSPSQASSTLARELLRVCAIERGVTGVAAGVGQGRERRQNGEQEPREPHAFAAALWRRPCSCRRSSRRFRSTAGRAIPTSRFSATARTQCSYSDARWSEIEGCSYASCSSGWSSRPSRNDTSSSSTASISSGRHVMQRRVDQPQPIVGEPRPHAFPAGLVPPVLHVAFDELP